MKNSIKTYSTANKKNTRFYILLNFNIVLKEKVSFFAKKLYFCKFFYTTRC